MSQEAFKMRRLALGMIVVSAAVAASPTFTKDVAPILYRNCVSCHRPGEIAPMSLLDYKSARPWAKSIRGAVITRKMPPWFADPKYGHFSNDSRLSDRDIGIIRAWVDGGAIEGDPKDLPPQPYFAEGWTLGKPDVVIDIGKDFQVPEGNDRYEYFTVATNFTEGKWVRAAQILPGNRQVVHHAHVYLLDEAGIPQGSSRVPPEIMQVTDGLSLVRDDAPVVNDACADTAGLPILQGFSEGSFTAFLPGRQPDVFGENTAKWIPAGAKLRFQIHYAKVSKTQTDRTSVGLYLTSSAPARPLHRLDLRNHFFRIPAGAPSHPVTRCYDFEADKQLVSITPHMHFRGKDARYELVRPDGRREVLLSVPTYSFEWQLNYRFNEPVYVEKGSRLIVTFHYDNSRNNPANPDAARVVRWGDRTEDEMMTSWIEYLDAPPNRQAAASSAYRPR
jgi:hypothetical protein